MCMNGLGRLFEGQDWQFNSEDWLRVCGQSLIQFREMIN